MKARNGTLLLVGVTVMTLLLGGGMTPANAAKFTPDRGVTFNTAVGSDESRWAIHDLITRSIRSTPRKGRIHIFTWNFMTSAGADALLRAQERGVRVRLLMANVNLSEEVPNPAFVRLQKGLRRGSKGKPAEKRSWARLCDRSCRGKGGQAHSKYFLFSRVGEARHVYIQGSANYTRAAATNQWNDVVTHRSRRVYRWALDRFQESAKDEPAKPIFSQLKLEDTTRHIMFPALGTGSYDPVGRLLSKIKCRGALNTESGRTVIRIAPDVVRHERGMRLARQVRDLWERGCDIRLGYTVMGIKIGRMLRSRAGRGPVPMKHFVEDYNGDGQFDNYFHLKAVAVTGNVNGNPSASLVLNGSANWSRSGQVSDENVAIYPRPGMTRRYQQFIDTWWDRFPPFPQLRGRVIHDGMTVSPYRPHTGPSGLVFGTGRDITDEFGNPIPTEVDPFATLDAD